MVNKFKSNRPALRETLGDIGYMLVQSSVAYIVLIVWIFLGVYIYNLPVTSDLLQSDTNRIIGITLIGQGIISAILVSGNVIKDAYTGRRYKERLAQAQLDNIERMLKKLAGEDNSPPP